MNACLSCLGIFVGASSVPTMIKWQKCTHMRFCCYYSCPGMFFGAGSVSTMFRLTKTLLWGVSVVNSCLGELALCPLWSDQWTKTTLALSNNKNTFKFDLNSFSSVLFLPRDVFRVWLCAHYDRMTKMHSNIIQMRFCCCFPCRGIFFGAGSVRTMRLLEWQNKHSHVIWMCFSCCYSCFSDDKNAFRSFVFGRS